MKNLLAAAALALAFSATTVQAAPEAYEFDKAHTSILFFVSHLGFSDTVGEFHDYTGNVVYDRADVANSSVDVTIQTKSVDVDWEATEEHLRKADYFHVEKYPEMTFKSTKVEKTGENTGTMTGELTLLGTTKPVTLDITFNKSGAHPYSDKFVAGFTATGAIKRSDFGMTTSIPAVGDEVKIHIEAELLRKEDKMPNAR